MSPIALVATGLALNGAAAGIAAALGSLDFGGAITGVLLGTLVFAAGAPMLWCILAAFFLSSTALGHVGRDRKAPLEALHEKGGKRDLLQVLANGGIGMIAAIAYRLTDSPAWAVGFAASFAAANADTWAGEIGVLSRRDPVSILTFRPVVRGVSGGISVLGSCAALAGAVFIALLFWAAALVMHLPLAGLFRVTCVVAACGFVGSFVDSLLGATLQAQYYKGEVGENRGSWQITERRFTGATRNTLARGLPFVTNDVVNAASCAVAAAAAVLLYPLVV